MKLSRHTKVAAAVAGAASIALLASACSAGGGDEARATATITLTVTTFGTFGYDGPLQGVRGREPERHDRGDEHRHGRQRPHRRLHQARRRLGPHRRRRDRGGLARRDHGGLRPVRRPHRLRHRGPQGRLGRLEVRPGHRRRRPRHRLRHRHRPRGRLLQRPTLFEAAGLPDRPRGGRRALGGEGDWDQVLRGRQAVHTRRPARRGSTTSGFVWNAHGQPARGGLLHRRTASSTSRTTPSSRSASSCSARRSASGQSAAQAAWDWNGGKSFVDGTFATFVCPGWMLGVVQGNVEAGGGDATTGWDFADVFPGGAANWGGAFLSVPETSRAQGGGRGKLADWLTAARAAGQAVRPRPATSRAPSRRRRPSPPRRRRTSSSTTHRPARSSRSAPRASSRSSRDPTTRSSRRTSSVRR